MPSSQITRDTPESASTSRSRRSSADGPPPIGLSLSYFGGPTTWLPPIPALTTTTFGPPDLYTSDRCTRAAKKSGHRSSPLMVEFVPSVIESPSATTTLVSAGTVASTASRKYQDVVVNGNAASSVMPSKALCTAFLLLIGSMMAEARFSLEVFLVFTYIVFSRMESGREPRLPREVRNRGRKAGRATLLWGGSAKSNFWLKSWPRRVSEFRNSPAICRGFCALPTRAIRNLRSLRAFAY